MVAQPIIPVLVRQKNREFNASPGYTASSRLHGDNLTPKQNKTNVKQTELKLAKLPNIKGILGSQEVSVVKALATQAWQPELNS